MSVNREKSSRIMGIAVSVLLHGIFFAGCLALDAASVSASSTADAEATEINQVADQADAAKPKS
jgi:hypothetical protein